MGLKDRFLDIFNAGEPRALQARFAELSMQSRVARDRWAEADRRLVEGAYASDEERNSLTAERDKAHEEMVRALHESQAVVEEMKSRGISVKKARDLYDERLEREVPIVDDPEPTRNQGGRTA